DKDIKGITQELQNFPDTVILTQADNPRAIRAEILSTYFEKKEKIIIPTVKEALQEAVEIAREDDLILITGSLFLVGEARKLLKSKKQG
ncbi:MAG: bifunctional folylpolyglutamate synthase/dihydrofolate synthase, partial [Candidatus Omnitrophica bacterium]|nr:bifunctional folylpolyglutamate synthase/dihydrofolate synthase [Candidatus Omnitrophota bacterium]